MQLWEFGFFVAHDFTATFDVGRTVIADSVNPIPLSRDAWFEVAKRA
jgi:hypothetical protein